MSRKMLRSILASAANEAQHERLSMFPTEITKILLIIVDSSGDRRIHIRHGDCQEKEDTRTTLAPLIIMIDNKLATAALAQYKRKILKYVTH
jgi:hypothetical protein